MLSCFALLFGCGAEPKPAELKKYNIVLVLVDTLRADRMHLYGYERDNTPFIDQLAQQSTVLERHYAQAGCTFPSVNSLFTSRAPEHFLERASTYGMAIPEDTPTLAHILAESGYQTLAISSSVIVRKTPSFNVFAGFDAGFQSFDETCEEKSAYCVNQVFSGALDSLEEPFFAYLHYLEPHAPYRPPKWHRRQWATTQQAKPWLRQGDGYKFAQWVYEGREFDREGPQMRHLNALYDEEILYFDVELENLVGELERRGVMERTILVLVSDHGEEFLEHGHAGHCRDIAYDTMLAVPGLIRLPEQHAYAAASRGLRVAQATQNLDIAPTLLGLVGIEAAPLASQFEGSDLEVLWQQEDSRTVHRFTTAVQGKNRVLRLEPYKLIYDVVAQTGELYQTEVDPGEQRDLSLIDPERFALMLSTLRRMLAKEDLESALQGGKEIDTLLKRLGYL